MGSAIWTYKQVHSQHLKITKVDLEVTNRLKHLIEQQHSKWVQLTNVS